MHTMGLSSTFYVVTYQETSIITLANAKTGYFKGIGAHFRYIWSSRYVKNALFGAILAYFRAIFGTFTMLWSWVPPPTFMGGGFQVFLLVNNNKISPKNSAHFVVLYFFIPKSTKNWSIFCPFQVILAFIFTFLTEYTVLVYIAVTKWTFCLDFSSR